jgi:endonuclease IV
MSLRVRQILDQLKGSEKKSFLKHLPEPSLPSETKGLFPNALLTSLPSDQKYSLIGVLTEALVLSSEPITNDSIIAHITSFGIDLAEEKVNKIMKSKTTKDYITKVEKTREELSKKLDTCLNTIIQGKVLTSLNVEGHPDGICGDTVIEVKTTSKLETDIDYFLLQVFSYVAIGKFTKALLVLPLQQTVLEFDTSDWKEKVLFKTLLLAKAKKLLEPKEKKEQKQTTLIDPLSYLSAVSLVSSHKIGTHIGKEKTLLQTVQKLQTNIPYQIFYSSNQSTKISVKEDDLRQAGEYVRKNNIQVYIHSPYLINLSAKTDGDWNLSYMEKLLEGGFKLGSKGVVVHTGKHTKDTYEEGVKKMRESIQAILPFAKPECPLLLETPAGQGTETLQGQEEFLDFVESFKSPNIQVCLDTCHVFANGHDPLTYIQKAFERGLLKLVHYNDSQDCCGSCKDRHAYVGTGKIGLEKMTKIAEFCSEKKIHMVIE